MTNQSAELRERLQSAYDKARFVGHSSVSVEASDIFAILPLLPPQGAEYRRAIEDAVRIAVWNAAKDRGMADEPAYALIRKVIADPAILSLLPEANAAERL